MSLATGSVGQLVAVIRSQLNRQAPAGTATASGRKAIKAQEAAGSRYAEENLAALIELRVKQIGRDDPSRGRKAFRVFLEAVLAAHFGPGLMNDPGFHQMVDDVQLAMEANADCARLVDSAIAQLLAEK